MNTDLKFRVPTCVLIALSVCLFPDLASRASDDQDGLPSVGEIQKAWQKRQDSFKTARFAWKEQRTNPKGSISAAFGSLIEERNPDVGKGRIMPAEDTTVEFACQLRIGVDRMRFEYQGETWVVETNAYRKESYTSVFGEKAPKDLYPEGNGHATWPLGAIRKDKEYRDAGSAVLRPLILTYRPFVKAMQPVDLERMTLQNQRVLIDEQLCVELVLRNPRDSSQHLFVDPLRDFVLVRQVFIEQGRLHQQMDISYQHDPVCGWRPTDWKTADYGPSGSLLCFTSAAITDYEWNGELASKLFELDFPLGTAVTDETNMSHYIIKMDGTKRLIQGAEHANATYDQLLKGESAIGVSVLFVIVGVLVLCIVVYVCSAMWRRRHGQKVDA
jgi:hypothetical protein